MWEEALLHTIQLQLVSVSVYSLSSCNDVTPCLTIKGHISIKLIAKTCDCAFEFQLWLATAS